MILPVIVELFSVRCPSMTEHEAAQAHLPFLVNEKDLATALKVSKTHIGRLVNSGNLDALPAIRISERIIRFKRTDVEAFFGAPLAEVMPWLVAEKEPA
jgi:hypothetical protein